MNPKNNVLGKNKKFRMCPFFYYEKVPVCLIPVGFLILMAVFYFGTAFAGKIPDETNRKLRELRIPFILNQGQVDQQVRFFARTFNGTVYVTDRGKIVYQLPASKDQKNQGWVLSEEALDGLPLKQIREEEESKARVSFFIGNDQAKWKSDLPTYGLINMGEIYKGIELKLRAYGAKVEKLYYVRPGQEPKEIQMKINGAKSLRVNDQGELEVRTGLGPVIFSRPRAFQKDGDKQVNVEVAYWLEGDRYGFKVGKYDTNRELVIDPLIQSTYLGGNTDDLASSLTISEGNVYVAGSTNSTNFPGTAGGAQPAYGGGTDAFVSLLSADLKEIIRSTYLGGNSLDKVFSIAVSAGGNVYVAGSTNSANFPGITGGAQPAYAGGSQDAFVSLLNADLTHLTQSTYLGGNDDDSASSIAVAQGNIYVAGYTNSTNFPGTAGGAQPVYGGGTDAFVSLLSADLTQFTQSTYLGGNSLDKVSSIAVSAEGNVYAAGYTNSTNFPGTTGGAQPAYAGGSQDAFVSLLNAGLSQITRSTYLGGNDDDSASSIALSGGNVYVAGSTISTNFPGTSGGAQPSTGGKHDAFVSLLSAGLTQITRSTYLGGNDDDSASSIALSGGNVYVAGDTISTNFPRTAGGAQPSTGGNHDVFVSLLSADLKQVIQSTYLGGNSNDSASSLALWGGNVYVAGSTNSTNFPGTTDGGQSSHNGGIYDAFISLLSANLKETPFDFDGDGKADILWRHKVDGMVYIWLMNGTTIASMGSPGTVEQLNWVIEGVGDFNGDGKADILWRHKTDGMVYIWLMNGTTIASMGSPGTVEQLNWVIEGVGDFNGDGKADILWRHKVDGMVYVWLINGTTIASQGSPGTEKKLNWVIEGVGDFNGDGKADILWRHKVDGMVYVWLINGTTIASQGSPGTVKQLNWVIN